MQHKRHAEYFRWFDLPFWKFFLFWSAHISQAGPGRFGGHRADLFRYYRLPRSQGAGGAAWAWTRPFSTWPRRRRPERFLLAASTLHPHKNLDGLLRAFAEFRRARPEFRLVVCGLHGFFTGPLHEFARFAGLRDAVEFPGWIPREDLHDLFARAWAFLCPSLFEGFGLPLVEALAAGIPTACSAIEPLSGIAGDAALQFDPRDPAAMAAAMLRIADDEELRARLAQAGPARAAEFSWRRDGGRPRWRALEDCSRDTAGWRARACTSRAPWRPIPTGALISYSIDDCR